MFLCIYVHIWVCVCVSSSACLQLSILTIEYTTDMRQVLKCNIVSMLLYLEFS